MEATKKLTNEEKRIRQHEIIQQWKKHNAEAQAEFEAWLKYRKLWK